MFAYLSKKIAIPNNPKISTLAWSLNHGYLACGGENGLLKVLKFESSKFDANKGSALQNGISMNQTLEGHSGTIQLITWNEQFEKLTTADEHGVIIVWMLYKGSWYEEMINNRNKSRVRGLKWDKEGRRICIAYEDGVVIVGSVDGNRIWCKELKCAELVCADWAPHGRSLLFGLSSGEIHVYDSLGIFLRKLPIYCLYDIHGAVSLVDFTWYRFDKGLCDPESPSLAVCFDVGRCQIMRNDQDLTPILLDTGLSITCCEWNESGSILAICGQQRFACDSEPENLENIGVVQFYNPFGDHLHSLTIPGKGPSACTWEGSGSLRLAMAIDSYIYFANVRLKYEWTLCANAHTLVYTFTRSDSMDRCVMFWDVKRGITHIRSVDNLLGICGDGDFCAVTHKIESISTPYQITVYNSLGCIADCMTTELEPKFSVMTGNYVVIANASIVFLWQFKNPKTLFEIGVAVKTRNKMRKAIQRMCHIDQKDGSLASQPPLNLDGSSSTATDTNMAKLLAIEPSENPIVALSTSETRSLFIARSNGNVIRYRLPELWPEVCIHATDKLPVRIEVNCDATVFGLIDEHGVLSLHPIPESEDGDTPIMERLSSKFAEFSRKEVWDLKFSTDNPSTFAIMEKAKLVMFRDTEAEPPIHSSVYIARFADLEVVGVQLDDIIQQCEHPKLDLVTRIPCKTLAECRGLLEHKQLDKAKAYVEEHPHPKLWQSYAEAALQEMQLNEAEVGFVMCQYYQGIDFVKKLRNIQSEVVRRAEVRAHFGDFDGAERLYLSTDRCDLAIDLRRRLGDWFRVAQLAKEFGAVVRDSELTDVWNALGDHYYDKAQWPQASEFYRQGGDFKKLVHCLFRMGDYSTMESLIHELPDGHSLLPEIARIFTWVSLAAPAAKALIKCDQLKEAVEVCIQLNDWSLAFQLTQVSSSSSSSDGDSSEDDVLTKTSLRRRLIGQLRASVNRMLEQSRPFEAIEMLKGAGYFLDSAKLLFRNPNQQESIFTGEEGDTSRSDLGVFGDQATFTERSRRRETEDTEAVAHGKQNDLLQLSNSYEITRLIDQPWRGAEACHYLMLSQHHLYFGLFEQALRTAILLRDYDDIFDARKIHSIIALCAVKSGAFATASKAFMKLQNLPGWSTLERQKLDDLIFEIFTRYPPKNLIKSASSIELDVVLESETKVPICVVTGQPVTEYQFWMCPACKHSAYESEISRVQNCPICHIPVQ
ncbi:WD repeat-containing protein 35 [Echinococcus granulosus]|uniref:WD repeat-containing protein 35 n=1 Tax=Echinococcus granulosus TaxID=6210 RepID=W6U8R4_ECHGR|nr:WD repeat-containing protein 35 [Echinococcus granulosus]EUB57703.1 WD repeat-containing protein 35 [Echinococcus granulosus]